MGRGKNRHRKATDEQIIMHVVNLLRNWFIASKYHPVGRASNLTDELSNIQRRHPELFIAGLTRFKVRRLMEGNTHDTQRDNGE